MAKQPALTLSSSLLFTSLLLSFLSGRILKLVNGQRWCIAKPSSTNATLMGNLDYACGHANCDPLQEGGPCFYPYTRAHHASFAMNEYFVSRGGHTQDCDFRNSGLIAITDPSSNGCSYGGASSEVGGSKTWCVAKPNIRDDMLLANRDYACNNVDCGNLIQAGGPCYNPTTLLNHASVAMNLYYQSTGREASSCDFRNSGVIVTTDPSYGGCMYEFNP